MHSHLHTEYNINCEEIMTALDECHARGFIYKALGNCNDIKIEVNKCLSAERFDRAKNNRDNARNKRRRIEEIWAKERALSQPAQSPAAENSDAAKQ
ncbi:COX assembly mitochondrial protein 1 [Penicillium rolfsii]|nr:COX assembly mitochondrial protein 1 [Penicillium rolfsii]